LITLIYNKTLAFARVLDIMNAPMVHFSVNVSLE
jgi:hypothetical protein